MRKPVVPPRQAGAKPAASKTAAPKPAAAKPASPKAAASPKSVASKLSRSSTAKPAASKVSSLQERRKAKGVAPSKRSATSERRAQVRTQLNEIRRFTRGSRLKRTVTYSVFGSLLALVLLVLATIYTPMMSIDKIEIVGLHRMKEATVRNAVKSLMGTPLTTVDENQIQKRLAGFPLIESFTTVSLPPHTLQLYIRERQPIGIVAVGASSYLYDPAGVQIGVVGSSSKYPTILVTGNPSHSASFREAVSVLLALPADLFPKVASIQATSVDDVRIRLRGVANTQILWGDASDSLLKSKVLTALLATVKKRQLVVFDVSSPSAPTVRFGAY